MLANVMVIKREYKVVVSVGADDFEEDLNALALEGWSLVTFSTEPVYDEDGESDKAGQPCYQIYRAVMERGIGIAGGGPHGKSN